MMPCTLCDLPTPDPPVSDADVDGSFCCRGCLEVARALDGMDADAADVDGPAGVRAALDGDDAAADAPDPDGTETAFVAVDGMHCATCEAFLETRATDAAGVVGAEASYPSNLVRLVYDPGRLDEDDLPAILDGAGYRARPVDAEGEDDTTETVGRLVIGGFFAMMTMAWYVLFLYPTYLGLDVSLLDVDGLAGQYLLWNVWLMTSVVFGYTGYPILRGAYVSLRAGQPNMDLLVALAAGTAYVYSTATLLLGGTEVYFDITTVVVVVVTLGGYYETRLKERAAGRLTELTESRVAEARRRTSGGEETVAVEDVTAGDELVVGAGERLPVDGTVIEGTAAVDESLVTGESVPVRRDVGDEVIGGGLVTEGGVVIEADEAATSTLDRLVTHLWNVRSSRSGVQRLADRIAAVFVPVVVLLALAAFVTHLALGAAPTAAFLTGLTVLVVSCPCALGLATPLAVAAGVREALDSGVVVTDGDVFERATAADIVAFDKTGTLTTGEMRLVDAVGEDTDETGGHDAIARAAAVERFADHPMGRAVTEAVDAGEASPTPRDAGGAGITVDDFERHPGRGVSGVVSETPREAGDAGDGDRVTVGRADLFDGCAIPDRYRERYDRAVDAGRVAAYVGWSGRVRGVLVAGDEPRPEWESVVSAVAEDVGRVVVITGDGESAAARFREHPDVDDVFAGVPPEAKAEVIDRLRTEGTTVMVGDGSNDAPALAAADLGISLESGTRLAADAADAVITTDDLTTVPAVFDLTAATKRRLRGNLAWAFLYNALAVPAAALGVLNPLVAAVAMAASSLLVVGNSARGLGTDSEAERRTGGVDTGADPVPSPAD
ncbi:heavy metal translocating P-type ATPase [Haloplanus rubicundus]|uniref:Heavy metal translocating P-type ATPase n=1 Tax=Haloplanus rubicundus TaxID=1547898 RepID=A0A345E0I3_9EURY|nr:heavy metal translocating P-type ATPase [Haloplanus rubicundus]